MITYRVDVYGSRPIGVSLLTYKLSAGMPGPEGPANRGWLGVVTSIRGVLVLILLTLDCIPVVFLLSFAFPYCII